MNKKTDSDSYAFQNLSKTNLSGNDKYTQGDHIIISEKALNLQVLNQRLQQQQGESGASVVFTGAVRSGQSEKGLTKMTLEHYPGMTESQLTAILQKAERRWSLNDVLVVHRVGDLAPGDVIVFVGVNGLHRKECFEAAQYIMDYLKQRATFWKKEYYGKRSFWVEAKQSDQDALNKWESEA